MHVGRARLGLSVAVALVAATLSACGAPRATVPDNAHSPYVALGDSFTSGPLIPQQSTDGCFRSTHNYPSLVAEELHIPELDDRSCGGAEIGDLTASQRAGVDPQLDALSDRTRLVTVGIGANDRKITATLDTVCLAIARQAPDGAPCRAAMQKGGTDQLLAQMPAVTARMRSALREIHRRSPQARVLVVGYPQSVPATGTCPERLPIASGDYAYFREVIMAVNSALRRATRSAGDTWVDVWKATAGHDICSDDPWINGVTPQPRRAAALHPFVAEQRAVADLVVAALDGRAPTTT